MTAWHQAVRTGDSATAAAISDSVFNEGSGGYPFTMADYAVTDGHGLASALALSERFADAASQRALMHNRQRLAANLLYVAGAPAAAAVRLRRGGPAGDPVILARIVRVGLIGDGDARLADSAAAELARLDDVPADGPDSVVLLRREVTRTLALWRLVRGDSSSARRDLARVRAMGVRLRGSGPRANDAPRDVHMEVLDALHARLRLASGRAADSVAFRKTLVLVEERVAELDWGGVNFERTVALILLSARLMEEAGDLRGAIRMAGRGTFRNGGELHPYYAVQARTVARLASQAGDTTLARASWERLLQLRVRGEPSLSAELTEARTALTP
jgi:hypothetical protein